MKRNFIEIENGKYTIFSGLPEFGYELISTLPYCYYLFKKGLLKKTISGIDTKCLYYFSPDHEEVNMHRSFENVKMLQYEKFPNMDIHRNQLDWEMFCAPKLKENFFRKAIVFSRPTVVIANRFNNEWRGEPVNFITAKTVLNISDMLSPKFQVVLIQSSDFTSEYEDHAGFKQQRGLEESVCEQHNILTLRTLCRRYGDISINELQCRIYAGCEKFISSNGGLGIFTSYFGGENIIFSKMCHELDPEINSFSSWYYKLSGSSISVVNREEDLIEYVKSKWINNDILFNILIRTSNRPNYFHDCIVSILNQKYKNFNIIVGVDDPSSIEYVKKHPCSIVSLKKNDKEQPKPDDNSYGIWFPYNEYFNILQQYVKKGYIIYLDDDGAFQHDNVLSELNNIIKTKKNDVVFFRVKFPDRIVPSDSNFALKKPVCRDIDTIGFCFSSNLKPTWEPFKRGDYRAALWLWTHSKNQIWINAILTKLQREKEGGNGKKDDKDVIYMSDQPPLTIIVTAYHAAKYLKQCVDSIIVNIQGMPNIEINIILGVDSCNETKQIAKVLAHVYAPILQVYWSNQNVGTYCLKNSLLKKIRRRDSLIMFFDSDDIMPPYFLEKYYNYFCEISKYHSHPDITKSIVLRTMSIGVHDKFIQDSYEIDTENQSLYLNAISFLKSKNTEKSIPYILALSRIYTDNILIRFIERLVRFHFLCLDNFNELEKNQYHLRSPHGVFMLLFETARKLGFFYPYRVNQDTDFLNRAKKLGVNLIINKQLPAFIRRVTQNSLTCSPRFGLKSSFRDQVREVNKSFIEKGIFIASGEGTEISRLL